jgi:hypothetical protein
MRPPQPLGVRHQLAAAEAVANERQGLSRALMATVYPSLGFRPSPLSAWTLMLMLQLSDAAG